MLIDYEIKDNELKLYEVDKNGWKITIQKPELINFKQHKKGLLRGFNNMKVNQYNTNHISSLELPIILKNYTNKIDAPQVVLCYYCENPFFIVIVPLNKEYNVKIYSQSDIKLDKYADLFDTKINVLNLTMQETQKDFLTYNKNQGHLVFFTSEIPNKLNKNASKFFFDYFKFNNHSEDLQKFCKQINYTKFNGDLSKKDELTSNLCKLLVYRDYQLEKLNILEEVMTSFNNLIPFKHIQNKNFVMNYLFSKYYYNDNLMPYKIEKKEIQKVNGGFTKTAPSQIQNNILEFDFSKFYANIGLAFNFYDTTTKKIIKDNL